MSFLGFGVLVFAYLLGSINNAIIICYIFKLPSPRSIGSTNPGTTNVLRIGGKWLAIITLIFDILKGFIPVILAKILIKNDIIIICTAFFAVIGHIFPLFFKFKGGKGVATFIGVLFALNYILGLVFIISWLFTAKITRYSSLSAIIAIIIVIFFSMFIITNMKVIIIFLIKTIIILIKHIENIKKLINKKESKIGNKTKFKK